MNIKTKMQKIISGVLLSFAFFMFVPIFVFAEVSGARTTSSVVKIGVTERSWVNTILSTAAASTPAGNLAIPFIPLDTTKVVETSVNLERAERGGGKKITDNAYAALTVLARGGVENTNNWINPETKKPYEKENIYTIATNDGVSYYYKPNGGTDKERNENTVLIAHANDGKVYIPNNTDGTNYLKKGGDDEKNFNNNIDKEAGRELNTTNNKLAAVDGLKQNKETLDQNKNALATNQQELEALLKQRDADDVIREMVAAGADQETAAKAMTDEDRAKLDQDIENKRKEINTRQQTIQDSTAAVEAGEIAAGGSEISTESCKGGFLGTGIGFDLLNPDCIISLLAIIANFVLKISALVLYFVGILFDYSIEIAVNSAQFIASLQIIDPTWAAIRDFLNMTFIFVLIYISWQILIGNSNYNAKNSVARLVLVAILINFSLFAAKLMVDGSNIISLSIYEGIKTKGVGEPGRGSVSSRVMTTLGLTEIFKFSDAFDNKTIPGCGNVPGTILTVSIFGSIMILITAMTFLLAAILFFIRILNIIVLFITSPVWVWGYVIQDPRIKQHSEKWWSNMMHVVKFPIMYMLILYISLAMFAQLGSSNVSTVDGKTVSIIQMICGTAIENKDSVSAVKNLPIIINFVLVIAALIGAIKYSASESLKASGTGKFASGIASKFEGFSKKISSGAAQGLYNKATSARGLAAIGVAATGGVGGLALAGGAMALAGNDRGKNLTQYGLHKTTGWLADKAGEKAIKGAAWKKTAFAMLSDKLNNTKIFGETSKEAGKRRSSVAVEREKTLTKIQADQTKIESKESWVKKNPTGDYDAYVADKINMIEDIHLGSLRDASSQEIKDSSGNKVKIKNSDFIRQAMEDELDDKGNVIGKKLNQDKLYRNIEKVISSHEKDGSYIKHMSRWETFSEERAKARIKERKSKIQSIGREAKSVEKINKEISSLQENLERLPSVDKADPNKKSDYHGVLRSYFTEREKIIKDRNNKLTGASPSDKSRIMSESDNELLELKLNTSEKIEKEKSLIEDKIEKKEKQIRDMEEKEAKKKEETKK